MWSSDTCLKVFSCHPQIKNIIYKEICELLQVQKTFERNQEGNIHLPVFQ